MWWKKAFCCRSSASANWQRVSSDSDFFLSRLQSLGQLSPALPRPCHHDLFLARNEIAAPPLLGPLPG